MSLYLLGTAADSHTDSETQGPVFQGVFLTLRFPAREHLSISSPSDVWLVLDPSQKKPNPTTVDARDLCYLLVLKGPKSPEGPLARRQRTHFYPHVVN